MSRYGFVTQWRLEAPPEPVWDTIYDTDSWPEWWPGVRRVEELVARPPDGVGGVPRFTFRSVLPYDLVFVLRSVFEEEAPAPDAVELARGDRDGGSTTLFYQWDVRTTRPWMNALAPLARPAFAWNHDRVMAAGGEGLARRLGARLLPPR